MSYADLLIETCTVYEFGEGGLSPYGIPEKTWTIRLDDTPCRLSRPRFGGPGHEVKVGAEVVIAPYTLFVGDIDISEQERVVKDGVTYEILLVEEKEDNFGTHHKECLVRTVR